MSIQNDLGKVASGIELARGSKHLSSRLTFLHLSKCTISTHNPLNPLPKSSPAVLAQDWQIPSTGLHILLSPILEIKELRLWRFK